MLTLADVDALVVVPHDPESPLLRLGPCGAAPPILTRWPDGGWRSGRLPPHHAGATSYGLALAFAGELIPDGIDRLCRALGVADQLWLGTWMDQQVRSGLSGHRGALAALRVALKAMGDVTALAVPSPQRARREVHV